MIARHRATRLISLKEGMTEKASLTSQTGSRDTARRTPISTVAAGAPAEDERAAWPVLSA